MPQLGKPLTIDGWADIAIAFENILNEHRVGNADCLKIYAGMIGQLLATAPAEDHAQLCCEVGEMIVKALACMSEMEAGKSAK